MFPLGSSNNYKPFFSRGSTCALGNYTSNESILSIMTPLQPWKLPIEFQFTGQSCAKPESMP